jgi:hypothetical protein
MDDPLAIYIQDHLTGSRLAVDLLVTICRKHVGDSLAEFATALLNEVQEDRQVLQSIAERVGTSSSGLKEFGGWLFEIASRFKLDREPDKLGTLEAMEFLALGAIGKESLWRALGAIASAEPRLQGIDFDHLASRAHTQYTWIEDRRIEVAKMALLDRLAA